MKGKVEMKRKLPLAIIILFLIAFLFFSLVRVPDGYVKIAVPRALFKEIKVFAPGIHFIVPFLYSVERYSTSPADLASTDGFRVLDRIGSGRLMRFKVSYQFDKSNLHLLAETGGNPPQFILKTFEDEMQRFFALEKEILSAHTAKYHKELRKAAEPLLKAAGINLLSFTIADISVDYGDVRKNELAKLRLKWEEKKRRVILIGMDALDLRIMRPLLNAGELPNFAYLISNGTSGVLKSIKPMLSPLIWTTMATGVSADKHGILDFIQRDKNGNLVPITSNMRKVPAVWNILSEMNIPVGFVAWWATWPAEKVNGFIVSERLSYQLFNRPIDPEEMKKPQGKVYPPNEYEGLTRLIADAERIDYEQISRFVHVSRNRWDEVKSRSSEESGDKLLMLRNLIASTDTYHRAGLDLYKKYKPTLFSPYFEGTDVIGHLFMEFYPPKRTNVSDADFAGYKDAVSEYYKYIDSKLRDYIALVDEGTDLLIVSDHGFKSGEDRPYGSADIKAATAVQWHDIDGTIIMFGKSFKKGYLIQRASVYDVLPTVLAMLGLPADMNMEGKVIKDAFAAGLAEPERVQDYTALIPTHGAMEEVAKGIYEKEMMKKLARLGYISPDTGKVSSEGESLLSDINKAAVLIERKQYDQAEKILLDVTKREPKLSIGWGNLARIYRERGDKKKEAEAYTNMLGSAATEEDIVTAVNGAARALFEMGKSERALGLLNEALKKYPESYEMNAATGKIYLAAGQYRNAVKHFEKVLSKKPDEVDILNQIALAYFNLGDETKASQYWNKSFKIKPQQLKEKTLNYYLNLGVLYMEQKKYLEAVNVFQTALSLNPKHHKIWTTLGNIYMHTGAYQNAEKAFKEAIKLSKDPEVRAGAYLGLVIIYNYMNKPDLALQSIIAGVNEDPQNYMLHRFYGSHFIKIGDLANAGSEYEKVISLKKDDWEVMTRLGAIYAGMGRKNDAIAILKRSIALNPDQPKVRRALSELGAN
jgi:Flp pilus assembly protein TadD/predicted AlkP superfamily phosphohydrolase/phosphomutase